MYLSNATESGSMVQGCHDLEIENSSDGFYFMYKMIDYGYVVGHLQEEDKHSIFSLYNSEEYYNFTKIVFLSPNKETGQLIFVCPKKNFSFSFSNDLDAFQLNKS